MDPKFILTNDDTNDTNDTTDSSIATTSTNNSKKKRGVNRKYYFSSDHESFIEAKKLIDSEKTWTAITPKNNTHYYRCNKVVSRSSKWCSAAVYIYKHQDSNTASIYRTMCEYIYI
jgi:prolyl oligopeptidase PreP (S9A serine peptidase family)